MFSQIVGNLIFVFLLVFANGFFVAAEFAIVKVRATQISEQVKRGRRFAPLAQHIIGHLDAYLSACQLGITFTSLGLGWVGEPLLAEMIRQPLSSFSVITEQWLHIISFIFGFSILTFLHIVLGEQAPKMLAIQKTEATTFVIAFPLQVFYRFFKPAIWVLNKSANGVLRMFGINPVSPAELVHSSEELEMMVDEGARTGVLTKTEQELISSIFEFSNTTAKEIMVPRMDVVAIKIDTSRDRLIQIVTEEGYSRMPVYQESIDNIVGLIYTKDLISLLEHRDLIVLQDIIRPAHFVPDAIKISQLMKELQERKMHMAIVVDEFGGTQGIVTMEDILEEIVGEIHDEYDEVLKDVEQSTDGSALVNAKMNIKDFNERFGAEIPDDPEFETINGLLAKITGHIPEMHEEIRYDKLKFVIVKKSPRRIRQVRVTKIPDPEANSSSTTA
jgi:CBS domain containing-hemolysin-like protein